MKSETERILERVRKLMRLANDPAAAEGERDNALRMAHATLAKHNLSMSEAEAAGAEPEEERTVGPLYGRNHPWTRTVATGIAKLFFCEYFYVPLKGAQVIHYFVGRQSNVITANEMQKYITKSIDREAQAYARRSGGGGSDWRSFCKGAALKVYWRCDQIQKDATKPPHVQASAAPGTAIVLASVYEKEHEANKAFIANMGGEPPKVAKDRQRKPRFDALQAGMEYAETLSLQHQIGSNAEERKALK